MHLSASLHILNLYILKNMLRSQSIKPAVSVNLGLDNYSVHLKGFKK